MDQGRHLLFQDRRRSCRSRHSRRFAGRDHHVFGFGHASYGEEERDRAILAIRRDPWLYVCHLLGQDWYIDYQSDVC